MTAGVVVADCHDRVQLSSLAARSIKPWLSDGSVRARPHGQFVAATCRQQPFNWLLSTCCFNKLLM